MIKRVYDDLDQLLRPQRVLVIYGPRRVGKTTLLKQFLAHTRYKYRLDSGDNIQIQHVLGSRDFTQILEYVHGYELLALDEAQQIPDIGTGLKIIVDQAEGIKVIATGSSSFDLSHQIGEPLTGRKQTIILYPISQLELLDNYNRYELRQRLPDFLIYGAYPEIVTAQTRDQKITVLQEIVNSYLFKDILALEKIKGSQILLNLLKLLAFQIGGEVSFNELASQLSIDVKTVSRYIDLLEKAFVIKSVGGYSRNLRSEITSKNKYYFLDLGIRNAVTAQFNSLDSRNDLGQLWENFIVIERFKKRAYQNIYSNTYFWRTYDQQEIDLVEERDGKLYGYECKWSVKKEARPPKDWLPTYPQSSFEVITPDNYLDFIT